MINHEENKEIFNNWLSLIGANHIDDTIKIHLKYSFYFAKEWIDYKDFYKNHEGVVINTWIESKYLLRDERIINMLLIRLTRQGRRNALAALNGYTTNRSVANALGEREGHIGVLLDPDKGGRNSLPQTLSPLALLCDVPDDQIMHEKISLFSSNFNNYDRLGTDTELSKLNEVIRNNTDQEYFRISNDLLFISSQVLYARKRCFHGYQTFEVYGLNENSLEIHDFRSILGFQVHAIVITPAILRNQKKVVYYCKLNEEGNSLDLHLSEMKLRFFSRVFEIVEGSAL